MSVNNCDEFLCDNLHVCNVLKKIRFENFIVVRIIKHFYTRINFHFTRDLNEYIEKYILI